MLQELKKHIENNFLFLKEKKILVACSGGLDSVVLSWLLKEYKFNISLAHCNFSLRELESDEDESFVVELADKLSIPVFIKKVDTKKYVETYKVSTQMAARELRYQWFQELCKEQSFDYVVTGHHLDDDFETFLINLSRGTGLRGLTGIPSVNEIIIRPLLNFSRKEILTHAINNKISWREDSSNAKTDYVRNKLRIDVIPKYKELDAKVLDNFKSTQEHLKASQSLVNDYMVLIQNLVMSESADGIQLDINQINNLPNKDAVLYELLAPYGFTAWSDILDLLSAQSGKQIYSKTHRLLKHREVLLLSENSVETNKEPIKILTDTYEIFSPLHIIFEEVSKALETNKNSVYLDKEKLSFPLILRSWQEGDIFSPLGMQGKKKLSKFFKDEKLSLVAKEKIWVLCSQNQIVWVVGMRLDDRFKTNANTKKILKIALKEN